MSSIPTRFTNVTVLAKANTYFDGSVVSHTIILADGTKKTLGLIHPGSYHFNTIAAERMELITGSVRVTLDGQAGTRDHAAGTHFDIPANSGFTIEVSTGLLEFICSYIP
ncbi:MAG: pyrimidine/purine nucleoside phosphorylase [Opitutaceae bacterium]|nr:pyrimidine/purine nucleoside phosphorylase [Opitutaceae bacterium]